MDDIKKNDIKKNDIKNRILELKSEVFDLIKRQEMLVVQNNIIQEAKLKKVQEINELETLHGEDLNDKPR